MKRLCLFVLLLLAGCSGKMENKIMKSYDFNFETKPHGVSIELVSIMPYDEPNLSAMMTGNVISGIYLEKEVDKYPEEYGPNTLDGGLVARSSVWENDKYRVQRTYGNNYREIVVRYIITKK